MCGGTLVMDVAWEFAECEQCGLKYTTDSVKRILTGQPEENLHSELDKSLVKGEQQLLSGDTAGAKNTYQSILDKIDPLNAAAWWGLLKCRFRYAEQYLAEPLSKNALAFLFDGKADWDMTAFGDNLKNAFARATSAQKDLYESEFSEMMDRLSEKRESAQANKGKLQLEREEATLHAEITKLQQLRTERMASLREIKHRKKLMILWLSLAGVSTLITLYITYALLTSTSAFHALLFEFIVSLFVMVVFWMIFSFGRNAKTKKATVSFYKTNATELEGQLNDAETRLALLEDTLAKHNA